MRPGRTRYLGTAGTLAFCLLGCYELAYQRSDMGELRRQFHLPGEVRFLAFDSSPKEAGFMGREGLSISAAVQFTEGSYEAYSATLNDPDTWVPVPYRNYSPDRGEEYSPAALGWRALPVLDWGLQVAGRRFRHWDYIDEALQVEQGWYYCSVLVISRGERIEGPAEAYRWRTTGLSCSELDGDGSAVVWSLGILDREKKRLHAFIGFSG
jgi:hypothetical protein